MARKKKRIPVTLKPGTYDSFPKEDIWMIIGGADNIIAFGGRTSVLLILIFWILTLRISKKE